MAEDLAGRSGLEEVEDEANQALIGWVLLGGLWLSVALMLLGLILIGAGRLAAPSHPLPIDKEPSKLFSGDPRSVLDLGILTLFATPLAGVVVALANFIRRRDLWFALITSTLLVILAIGFALALK